VNEELGQQYGVTWKGRNYNPSNWDMADGINKALSVANASLYGLCAEVVCSLGYLPSLGFVHDAGTLPFIYDVADLYKHLTSIPAAFMAIRQKPDDDGELVRKLLKQRVEEEIEGVRDVLGSQAALTGFYSYGEICPFVPGGRCELHNQTMTITTFAET